MNYIKSRKIIWIPLFGGTYCNFVNPSYYFKDSFILQLINFIYHMTIGFLIWRIHQ